MFVFGVTEVATRATTTAAPVLGTEPFAVCTCGVQVPAIGPLAGVNEQLTEVAVESKVWSHGAPPTVTASTGCGIRLPVIVRSFPVKVWESIASTGAV